MTSISGLREETRGRQSIVMQAEPSGRDNSHEGTQLHSWGGGLYLFPECFNLPDATSSTGWRLWWHGNRRVGIPPLRWLSEKDFRRDSRATKTWVDWKGTFRFYKSWCKQFGCYWQHPAKEKVEEMH